ncbi:hypothetical protein E2562_005436 [Oryza meyeriana var. granulata]|uniref:GATA-type domain-containing protein n=1 Tax=Oryza meyeriana var. granulata TaxID=110450 RepID=A0A6G1DF75_9ORYZ|nr:hypothetical protein E2562_005436 [Oryza meyeriana var. granulata]
MRKPQITSPNRWKLTPYAFLDVPFDGDDIPSDLVDGKGLCCPNDPIDEVMSCLPVLDETFLKALVLDCWPPQPPAAGGDDMDSKSEEHVHEDVGALDSQRALDAGDNKAGSTPTVDDVPWFPISAAARKPRRRPSTVRKRVWSLASPQLAAADNNHDEMCGHCHTTETPQWRAGPDGPSTLCNACGIRYRMNQLLPEYRPSTSPGFGRDEYSNRHRKVLELGEKKQEPNAGEVLGLCATVHTSS